MDTGDERGRPGRSTRRKRTPRRKAAEQATFSGGILNIDSGSRVFELLTVIK